MVPSAALSLLPLLVGGPLSPAADSANAVLAESHARLVEMASLQATIVQRTELDGRRFESTGDYAAGRFPQMRLRLRSQLADQTLDFQSVCDGQVLWTVRELRSAKSSSDSGGSSVDISRYDVDRLRRRLENATGQRQQLAGQLALGGLHGMLASIAASFDLVESPKATLEQIVLVGQWKPGRRDELDLNRKGQTATVPTHIEVTLDRQTLMPVRLLYSVEGTDRTRRTPLLMLELRDVAINRPLDPAIFEYAPPETVAYRDLTKQTIDRIDAAE